MNILTEAELDILAGKIAERLVPSGWMKLKQAALYSNIGQKELVHLATQNKIDGFQDMSLKTKPWIFRKESIDKYRMAQCLDFQNSEVGEIAVDIISSLNI